MKRPPLPLLPGLPRQLVLFDLLLSDPEPDELEVNALIKMLAKLALDRAVNQDASRVVVPHVEDHDVPAVVLGVNVFGRFECEADAGKPPSRIKADGQFLAVALNDPRDRATFRPDLAVGGLAG